MRNQLLVRVTVWKKSTYVKHLYHDATTNQLHVFSNSYISKWHVTQTYLTDMIVRQTDKLCQMLPLQTTFINPFMIFLSWEGGLLFNIGSYHYYKLHNITYEVGFSIYSATHVYMFSIVGIGYELCLSILHKKLMNFVLLLNFHKARDNMEKY